MGVAYRKYLRIKSRIYLWIPVLLLFPYTAYNQTVVIHQTDCVELPKELLQLPRNLPVSDTTLLSEALRNFCNRLHSAGYLAASIDKISRRNDSLILDLHAGKLYHLSSLTIKDEKGKILAFHQNLSFAKLTSVYERFLQKYENSGYPFAQIQAQKIEENTAGIAMVASLQKGKHFFFRDLIIKGKVRLSPKYLHQYLQIKSGSSYNENKISTIETKIRLLPFASNIKPCATDFCDTIADVYLYLKKEHVNSLEGIIGFGSDSTQEGKLKFTGHISTRLYNPFKAGEELFLDWSAKKQKHQKLRLQTKFPYLFGTPFGIDLNFSLQKKDSSYVNIKYLLSAIYNINFRDKIALSYTYTRSFSSLQNTDTLLIGDVRSKQFGFRYQRTSLDNLFNPYRGYRFHLGIFSGKRETQSHSKPFVSFQTKGEYFIPLPLRFCLHFGARTKYKFGKFKNYANEAEWIGGLHSLRGFDEDFFPVSNYAQTSVELRYLFEEYSHLHLFFDMARIEYNILSDSTIQYPMGFGGGINFTVNRGIISLAAAWGKVRERPLKLSDTKIHIGLVIRF